MESITEEDCGLKESEEPGSQLEESGLSADEIGTLIEDENGNSSAEDIGTSADEKASSAEDPAPEGVCEQAASIIEKPTAFAKKRHPKSLFIFYHPL